jgi:hypothetical protein
MLELAHKLAGWDNKTNIKPMQNTIKNPNNDRLNFLYIKAYKKPNKDPTIT